MSDSFVIYRKPGALSIIGVHGIWENYQDYPMDASFCIQPWETSDSRLRLNILGKSTDLSTLKSWCESLSLNMIPSLHEANKVEFENYVQKVQKCISEGKVSKVVTSRLRKMPITQVNVFEAFQMAEKLYPEAFVYIASTPLGVWMGASPELFLSSQNGIFNTVALAGTLLSSDDSWTNKEMLEQGVIGSFLSEKLKEVGAKNVWVSERTTLPAGPLLHLVNHYSFEYPNQDTDKLLQTLHPTPAVGGYPQTEAIQTIQEYEKMNRGLFTGWLGLSDKDGFEFYVNIRCAQIFSNAVLLYAGSGINEQSNPSKEWDETAAKMNVIGQCFQ